MEKGLTNNWDIQQLKMVSTINKDFSLFTLRTKKRKAANKLTKN